MHKKIILILIIVSFLLTPLAIVLPAFASTQAVEYLCELGIAFYRLGKYEDALSEFEKVLMLEPDNQIAKSYVDKIFFKEVPPKPMQVREAPKPTRQEAMNSALAGLDKSKPQEKSQVKEKEPGILSGEYRLGLGVTPDDVIWKDANADRVGVPHEKNWRYLWGDQRENTYDPRIYDRLTLDMQTQFKSPLNAFMEITIDPWTFVGKNHVSVNSTNNLDYVDMDLKYWSADGRTVNETYRSNKGNIINLKQIKVHDGKTSIATPTGITSWNTNFNEMGSMDVNRDYRPIRKLWVDYKQDDYAIKVFPISDQFEALTSDDPLRISNNHVYWEESPWLDEYEPSRVFERFDEPIKKGKWIRRLSFFSKDSSDDYPHRLTFLRGASFKADTGSYSLEGTIATPMSLWDEYYRSNSVDGAVRVKVPVQEDLQVGFTTTSKVGLKAGSTEAWNQAGGLDVSYGLSSQDILYGEVGVSHTSIQEAKGFDTVYDGMAGKLGFRYDAEKEKKDGIYKSELYLAYMDANFYPGLSNYRYTRRDDPTLSRHIYFSEIKPEDEALIWGDGMDRGRKVIGLRLATKAFNEKLNTDIRYRNVNKDSHKYIESVLRGEATYKATPKLTSKLLAYYKHLPHTIKGYDPILYDKAMYSLSDYFSEDDEHPENAVIPDGKDPSIGSFGFGTKYDFTEQLSVEGIYELSNDPLDFPRTLLNDVYVTSYESDGQTYDKIVPFVYDQWWFGVPPYNYYNIDKARLIYKPMKELEVILNYTYNGNKFASGIDDNINHAGLELTYTPAEKLTFWTKYIYSKLIDIYKMNKQRSSDFYESHHNLFFGSEYRMDPDSSVTLLYGEFVGYDDPYEQSNWTLSALDTQHIFRFFYKRKF